MDKWRRQADSAREIRLEYGIQEVLSVVESGARRGRIKAGRRFRGAISASGDVRTKRRDPGIAEILQKCLLIDSIDFEWRDSIYTWCCGMDFRDVV